MFSQVELDDWFHNNIWLTSHERLYPPRSPSFLTFTTIAASRHANLNLFVFPCYRKTSCSIYGYQSYKFSLEAFSGNTHNWWMCHLIVTVHLLCFYAVIIINQLWSARHWTHSLISFFTFCDLVLKQSNLIPFFLNCHVGGISVFLLLVYTEQFYKMYHIFWRVYNENKFSNKNIKLQHFL